MKNQRGSAALWIVIILVIVIVAGAAYWYWNRNSNQPIPVNSEAAILPTEQTTATTTSSRNYDIFKASPTSGSAPLTVTFTYTFDANAMGAASDQFLMDFGDGTQGTNSTGTHTYTSPGTYVATISFKNSVEGPSSYVPIKDPSGNLLSQTITVTDGSSSNQPSVTINPIPATVKVKAPISISGTASGLDGQYVGIVFVGPNYTGGTDANTLEHILLNTSNIVEVTSGTWSDGSSPTVSESGTYSIFILDSSGKNVLASTTFTAVN